MNHTTWNLGFALFSTLVGAACATVLGEPAASGLRMAACPELGSAEGALSATYSSEASVNGTVAAFVAASAGLTEASLEAERVAAQACRAIGRDIGVSAASMRAQDGPGGDVRGACTAVAAKIEQILDKGVSGKVRVSAEPPKCNASAQARARCDARCDVELTPAEIVAQCEPGKLSGTCEGVCGGRCEGECRGDCKGECTARNAKGECVGTCNGECGGTCEGTCRAECRGEWRAPKCEADIKAPKANAACDASCDTYAEVQASCEPARIDIDASADVGQVGELVASLRAHLPDLLRAQYAIAGRMVKNAEALARVGAQLPDAIAQAGGRALSCIGASTDAVASASVRLNVTVEASASVTGKVGAGT